MQVPIWSVTSLPIGLAFSLAAFTKKGWYYCVVYLLFENSISAIKFWAVLTGIFNLARAQGWVVVHKSDLCVDHSRVAPIGRISYIEVVLGIGILVSATWSLASAHQPVITIFLVIQGKRHVPNCPCLRLGRLCIDFTMLT